MIEALGGGVSKPDGWVRRGELVLKEFCSPAENAPFCWSISGCHGSACSVGSVERGGCPPPLDSLKVQAQRRLGGTSHIKEFSEVLQRVLIIVKCGPWVHRCRTLLWFWRFFSSCDCRADTPPPPTSGTIRTSWEPQSVWWLWSSEWVLLVLVRLCWCEGCCNHKAPQTTWTPAQVAGRRDVPGVTSALLLEHARTRRQTVWMQLSVYWNHLGRCYRSATVGCSYCDGSVHVIYEHTHTHTHLHIKTL